MNAYKTRMKLRTGLKNLDIKEKEVWNKECNHSWEEADLSGIELKVDKQNNVYFKKDGKIFAVTLIDLIQAAYDNTSYGGMIRLDKVK